MRTIRRRRLESKTDYKTRLALLKSGLPRLVIRKTNRYITVQLVETNVAQDKVIVNVTSKLLLSKGWPKEFVGSLKSLQAAYLSGYMLAKMSKIKNVILDIGMYRSVKGSRIYAALKGVIDGGLKVAHDSSVLPSIETLEKNTKLRSIFTKLKKQYDDYTLLDRS